MRGHPSVRVLSGRSPKARPQSSTRALSLRAACVQSVFAAGQSSGWPAGRSTGVNVDTISVSAWPANGPNGAPLRPVASRPQTVRP